MKAVISFLAVCVFVGASLGADDETTTVSSDRGSSSPILCFHGENEVVTRQGKKMMKDLSVNEEVMVVDHTGVLGFEPVMLDIHHLPDVESEFYKISTEHHDISITKRHYLPVGADLRLVPSDEVCVGDSLLVVTGGGVSMEEVVRVEKVFARGLSNPLVASGNLVVNGVVASVYADDIQPASGQHAHAALWVVRQMYKQLKGNHYLQGASIKGMPYWAYVLNMMRETLF